MSPRRSADGGPQGTDSPEGSLILVAPVGRQQPHRRHADRRPTRAPVSPPSSLPIMVATPASTAAEYGRGLRRLHLARPQQQCTSNASALAPYGFIFMGYSCQT